MSAFPLQVKRKMIEIGNKHAGYVVRSIHLYISFQLILSEYYRRRYSYILYKSVVLGLVYPIVLQYNQSYVFCHIQIHFSCFKILNLLVINIPYETFLKKKHWLYRLIILGFHVVMYFVNNHINNKINNLDDNESGCDVTYKGV